MSRLGEHAIEWALSVSNQSVLRQVTAGERVVAAVSCAGLLAAAFTAAAPLPSPHNHKSTVRSDASRRRRGL